MFFHPEKNSNLRGRCSKCFSFTKSHAFSTKMYNITKSTDYNSSAKEREKKVLRVGMSELPNSWDPRGIWNYQHAMLLPAVFQTLVKLDENGNVVGELAERWEVLDSGKEFVFYLKKKSKFHDNSPVTAQDVQFSLSRVFWDDDESSVAYLRDVFTNGRKVPSGTLVSEFKAAAPNEFRIKLPNAYPPLLYVLAMAEFGIYSKEAVAKGRFVGSGQLIPEQKSEGEILLRRNCNYQLADLKINELELTKINGSANAAALLKQGKIDVAVGVYDSEFDTLNFPAAQVTRLKSLAIRHLYLNKASPTLALPAVRKALKEVVQSIVQNSNVRFSFETPLGTYLPKGVLPAKYYEAQHNETMVEQAKNILSKHAKGMPLRILLREGSNNHQLGIAFNQTFNALGFKTDASLRSPAEINKAIETGEFEMSRSDYFGMFPDPDGLLEGVGWLKHVESANLFKELAKVRSLSNPASRLAEYQVAFQKWEAEVPVIPMYQIDLPILHSKEVVFPASDYRFASDLWRIFWKAK